MPRQPSPADDLTDPTVLTVLLQGFQDRCLELALRARPGSVLRAELCRAAEGVDFHLFDRTGGLPQAEIEEFLGAVRQTLGLRLAMVADPHRNIRGLRNMLERMLDLFDTSFEDADR